MIIYYEHKAKHYSLTQTILKRFSHCEQIEIQHYKDLFDKTIGNYPLENCVILAKQEHIAILDTPEHYGFPWKSFFFKPSLNCLFDCTYCYLKGSFKNRFPVIFVNYEDFKSEIDRKIYEERRNWYQGNLTFYASNYSDLLAIDHWTDFCAEFFGFFEQYEDVLLETRTKSANIEWLRKLAQQGKLYHNTEIAFSLSPEEIATSYEPRTASLQQKLKAINELLHLGYRVGLRFLPLLPIENYQDVYKSLIEEVGESLPIEKISSIFIAPLIYNKGDFSVMKKKYPDFRLLDLLQENEKGLMKMESSYYEKFEQLFKTGFPEKEILWDYQ